jgi:hypothetical protein
VARLRGVSPYLKAPSGWLNLLQFLPPKLWGNLKDTRASKASPCYATSLPHMLNVGQMCSFCCLLIFLEVVCTADVPVSVFSFSPLQFCCKIGAVHVLLPFRLSKRKLFTASFPPQWKLTFFAPRHRCNILGVHVPSCFISLAWFYTSKCRSLKSDYYVVLL